MTTPQEEREREIAQLAEDIRRVYIHVPPPGAPDVPLYYPVAESLREELEARGWDIKRFSVAAAMPWDVAQEILDGARITTRGATCIARAFGTSPALWLNLNRRTRPAT